MSINIMSFHINEIDTSNIRQSNITHSRMNHLAFLSVSLGVIVTMGCEGDTAPLTIDQKKHTAALNEVTDVLVEHIWKHLR